MVQSICVNISGDMYQIIMLCQFLEGLFMLTNVFLSFKAQKIIGVKNDRTHQSAFKHSATISRLTCPSQISEVCWYFFYEKFPGILEQSIQGHQTSLKISWKALKVENIKMMMTTA